jgi:hypothetical protein
MNKHLAAIALAATATIATISPTMAADAASAFGKGRTQLFFTAGNGYAFNDSYLVLGLGVSHYVADGLNVGLAIESWSGSDPGIVKITPSMQYVFYQSTALTPYVGGFYRRTKINGLPDLDSVGGRAGVYLSAGRNAHLGIGAVYESYLDCNKNLYRSCDETYPEVIFTVAF